MLCCKKSKTSKIQALHLVELIKKSTITTPPTPTTGRWGPGPGLWPPPPPMDTERIALPDTKRYA